MLVDPGIEGPTSFDGLTMTTESKLESDDAYDIAIIGAGIHGVGVAEVAAAAGHRVLILEKQAPAAGTSSRSSKLIHGGLRYLETAQFSLVRQSLADRERLLGAHPDLVRLSRFLIPVFADSKRPCWKIRAGLSLYALLGGLRRSARFSTVPKSLWHSLDGLKTDGLRGVFQYQDGQTDDRRLTEAVLKNAVTQSARIEYPVDNLRIQRDVTGKYEVSWKQDSRPQSCRATVIVNAAGPWVNIVVDSIEPSPPRIDVDLVQGTHLILDTPVTAGNFYAESPRDRRPVFIMPWHGRTLIGTTESPFTGSPDDVQPLPEEEEYLLEVFRHYFPRHEPRVVDSFAGLRVLPVDDGNFNSRSRETVLLTDKTAEPHYIAIYGGKLTTFHSTAIKVMKQLERTLRR